MSDDISNSYLGDVFLSVRSSVGDVMISVDVTYNSILGWLTTFCSDHRVAKPRSSMKLCRKLEGIRLAIWDDITTEGSKESRIDPTSSPVYIEVTLRHLHYHQRIGPHTNTVPSLNDVSTRSSKQQHISHSRRHGKRSWTTTSRRSPRGETGVRRQGCPGEPGE